MTVRDHIINLADRQLRIAFEFDDSRRLCAPFLRDGSEYGRLYDQSGEAQCSIPLIQTGDYERRQYLEQFPGSEWDSYAEMKCLMLLASDALLAYDRVICHAVALICGGKAWLLSGPSGCGKSTHYRMLKKYYGNEIGIISGDNPVLSFEQDGRIIVHPSPWNGKEGWGSMESAPLAGVIMPVKSDTNEITESSLEESALPVFKRMNTYSRNEDNIHRLIRLEEILITSVPILRFKNTGDQAASCLLYDLIKQY